jgi:hypothetical protein
VDGLRETTFLPLAVSGTDHVRARMIGEDGDRAERLHAATVRAERAAGECWLSMLAGCAPGQRAGLSPRLGDLTGELAAFAGGDWWFSDGSVHRHKVHELRLTIEDAARDGDGEEYADAFASFDQAVATATVCAPPVTNHHPANDTSAETA